MAAPQGEARQDCLGTLTYLGGDSSARVPSARQSPKYDGEGSAPEPFDLFLSSIACCAGIFALNFCQARKLSTEGLGLKMECVRDEQKKLFSRMNLILTLPDGFPEKYRDGMVRAINQCAVKKHIQTPPEFGVTLV